MTQKEFINLINIDASRHCHYPFRCFVKTGNGETHLAALVVHDHFQDVFGIIKKYVKAGASFTHFSVDFSKNEDVLYDFVGIFTYQDEKWTCVLLPYDEQGNKLGLIESGQTVEKLLKAVISKCKAK